jgi:hypothetical protein
MNRHEHICESLELFAAEVMPEFKEREAERERTKSQELEPYIAAALERKVKMKPLGDDEIPTYPALGRRVSVEDEGKPSIYEQSA